jgi:hypothetical protein
MAIRWVGLVSGVLALTCPWGTADGAALPLVDAPSSSSVEIGHGVVSRERLISDIRATYELRIESTLDRPVSAWSVFDNQRGSPASGLRGDALAAAVEYEQARMSGARSNVGHTVVMDGTIDGQPVTFVAGDLSDTGTEVTFYDASGAARRTVSSERRYARSQYGFYDASGKLLARAYRGQGEDPNERGVDWTD